MNIYNYGNSKGNIKMAYRKVLLVKPKGRVGLGFAMDQIPIGLEYIAASIEDVVEDINIIDMEFDHHPFKYYLELFHPDLVGITMSATEHNEGLYLANLAKRNGIATVLGGYHPTLMPEALLSHPQVDMVIRGEGEHTMKELVQKGYPKGIRGISYKEDGIAINNENRPMIQDLDSLPFPARRLRRIKYNHMSQKGRAVDVICISRGCWGQCNFCCEPVMNNGHQRFRSPENVMKELLELVSFHNGAPLQIFAVDPNFMGDPEKTNFLCDLLHEHKLDIRFSVLARVDSVANHPQLVKKMCDNGFLSFEMGIESQKMEDLKDTRKGITLEMQKKAVKILRDNGANAGGTIVIGLPGQTEEEIKHFPVFAKELGLMSAAFSIATPFPGTEFYNDLDKKGLIVDHDWTKYDEMHSVFDLSSIDRKRLDEVETYCMARFWTINTFLDSAQILQRRSCKKITLMEFMGNLFEKLAFVRNAGQDLRKGALENHLKATLDAMLDAESEDGMRKIDAHSVIDMSRFLRIFGSQKIQCTLRCKEHPPVSYIIKTEQRSSCVIESISTISGKQDDATIGVDIDLNDVINMINDDAPFNPIIPFIFLVRSSRGLTHVRKLFRLGAAISTELGIAFLMKKTRNMTR